MCAKSKIYARSSHMLDNHPEILFSMRTILFDWMMDVCDNFISIQLCSLRIKAFFVIYSECFWWDLWNISYCSKMPGLFVYNNNMFCISV